MLTLCTYSLRNRPRPAFPCTLSSHGSHAIGQRSKSLQQIERVQLKTMQLGTPAADSMDIAAAPAWLQSSVASGAGHDSYLSYAGNSRIINTMKLSMALLASGAAALAPNVQRATQLATAVPKAPLAAAAAVVAAAPAPALGAGLSSGDLILPVGGLTLLLTGVIAGILGYTTIGDGPANPKNRG